MTRPIVESFTRKGWNVNHGEIAFGVFENRGDRRVYKPYEPLPSCSIAHILRSRFVYLSPGVKRIGSTLIQSLLTSDVHNLRNDSLDLCPHSYRHWSCSRDVLRYCYDE